MDKKGAIQALQQQLSQLPQWDASEYTKHYFADGMYCRSLFRPVGTLIVGKVHKKEHFYIVANGIVAVTNGDDAAKEIEGPAVIISQPGTKRAVLAITDATCITVHRTEETDLDEIERDLVEPDETALFDTYNRPKSLEKKL